ncbi:MAG TPA: arginine--tRNA ligase [Kofleriaceae bacterium]|nr:arginine--tRNA ligase [Kofleriaceae bacterium]
MATHHTPLHRAAAETVAAHAGIAATDLKVEAPPRAELGDLAVGCFAIAKARKQNPAEVARAIAAAFTPSKLLASATANGPFVNFRADRRAVYHWVVENALRGRLIPNELGTGKTICIDYGSPNISKHLAYHHIRGTTIGHALAQIFRALGYRVVGINFLGDWGTTHGMLLAAWARWGPIDPVDVTGLNALYVKFRAAMKEEPAIEQEGRAWFKRLEDGDPEARALWQRFRDVSWVEFQSVYEILGIVYDEVRGEAAYEPDMPRIFETLAAKGLTSESQGALVVELPDEKTPILLRTRDGTTLYATRDVAAAEYRWAHYHFTRSLYVVDRGQSLHFRQLFKLLGRMGHEWAARCEHVPYGLVTTDNQRAATRLGNVVLMRDVFMIAEGMIRERIATTNPDLPREVVDDVARKVGIGAIVFANLAPQREKDIEFDIDNAVSIEGDSGPYLQYSHARCASIQRRAGELVTSIDGVEFSRLTHDAEWTIARRLIDFPEVVVRASEACEPHAICHYLLQLAADFSRWYTLGSGDASLRVLCDDPATRRARLALTAAVQATLRDGLAMLGIGAPDQM